MPEGWWGSDGPSGRFRSASVSLQRWCGITPVIVIVQISDFTIDCRPSSVFGRTLLCLIFSLIRLFRATPPFRPRITCAARLALAVGRRPMRSLAIIAVGLALGGRAVAKRVRYLWVRRRVLARVRRRALPFGHTHPPSGVGKRKTVREDLLPDVGCFVPSGDVRAASRFAGA